MDSEADWETTAAQDRTGRVKMVMRLLGHWKVSAADQAALLGATIDDKTTILDYRPGSAIVCNREQYERVCHLLCIHKTLRLLFPQDRDLAYTWMTNPNKAFNNLTPVELIKEQGITGLRIVLGYLTGHR